MITKVITLEKPTEYYGLSTDTKPMDGVDNAALFIEMDTDKVYLFDAEDAEWLEVGGP